jgi:hypothetical protein
MHDRASVADVTQLSSRLSPHNVYAHTFLSIHENMTPEQKLRLIRIIGIATVILLQAWAKNMNIYASRFSKTPLHTSILSGNQWIQELLDGHEERFYNEMGMSVTIFTQLLDLLVTEGGLRDTRYVTAREQLAIFLHYARRGLSNRALQERFQRSADTISK